MERTSYEMVKVAVKALDDKKGEDIKIIKIDEISTLADYFIVVNGNNPSQMKALQDETQEQLSRNGYEPRRIEGIRSDNWILLDYGDVIIHIFSREDREFYDIERIWCDGTDVDVDEVLSLAAVATK